MGKIFLDSQEQGIVVFKIWQSLPYAKRILLSAGLIIAGLAWQFLLPALLPGIILVAAGNLFILPSGYDNRVKIGTYRPKAEWKETGSHKLEEFLLMEKKVKKWDVSLIDISNGLGFFSLLVLLAVLGYFLFTAIDDNNMILQILAANGAVLLIPFWLFGIRSKFKVPGVARKIRLIQELLDRPDIKTGLEGHDVDYFFLLGRSKDKELPLDVKFRVQVAGRHEDFLGLYGQIVMNHVQSTPYPYFYMVLVAKKGFGLDEVFRGYLHDPKKVVKEYKVQDDVEVMVIRQNTHITSGYYTKPKQVLYIFLEGLKLAEQAAVKTS